MTSRNHSISWLRASPAFVAAALIASACSSDAVEPAAKPHVAVSVEPSPAQVLTCTTATFSASVTGAGDETGVTWSVAGGGSVDEQGVYTAPIQVPSPAEVHLTATSTFDSTASDESTITLSTALPGAALTAGPTYDTSMAHHLLAGRGGRVYAVLAPADHSKDPSTYALEVAASSDGGATFAKPVVATDVADATVAIDCPSIAVDAGDPDTVYAAYLVHSGVISKTSEAAADLGGVTLALSVSHDAGKTFTSYALESHDGGWGDCPDVLSPSPGTVVVEAPSWALSYGPGGGLSTYVDGQKGAGFAKGTLADGSWVVDEAHAVDTGALSWISYNEGSAGLESPRLFAGPNGATCVTYRGGGDAVESQIGVQCSPDGKAFAAPAIIYTAPDSTTPHHPTGAANDGTIAVAFWTDAAGTSETQLYIARSTDGGATFDAPASVPSYAIPPEVGATASPEYPAVAWDAGTLWLAYAVGDGVGPGRLIVDKSCDGGTTWSGAQLVNGPEPTIQPDYTPPGIFIDGAPFVFAPRHVDALENDQLDLIRLAP